MAAATTTSRADNNSHFLVGLLQQLTNGSSSIAEAAAAIEQHFEADPTQAAMSTTLPTAGFGTESPHSEHNGSLCENPLEILHEESWAELLTTYCAVALVGILCEMILHTLKHKLHHRAKAAAMLNSFLNELTIMGIIGFITYIVDTGCIVVIPENYNVEVIHMFVFIMFVVYIMLVLLLTGILYLSLATYRNFEKMATPDVATLVTEVATLDDRATPTMTPKPSRHHWKRVATSCCCRQVVHSSPFHRNLMGD
mgnify:FL=1